MADLPHLAARLFNRPHYVTPEYAETVASVLAHRFRVNPLMSAEDVEIRQRPAKAEMLMNGIQIIPIVGGLYHRGDSLDAMSGAQSYTNLTNRLVAALDNKDVRGILLDIDSPGGEATGCFEFADTIRDASRRKPIWSIANGTACSAAYAVGCSAARMYATPSGRVGSIGVLYMHRDVSKMLEKAGVDITLIHAGEHKVDGNPYEPLPADVRAAIQAEVDTAYTNFVEMVAARRPMSAKKIRETEAAVFSADKAVELGLADEVAPFSEVLAAFIEEINPVFRVSATNGAVSRMSRDNPAPQASGPQIEGLSEALARARDDGAAAARAEMQAQVVDAYKQGRLDAAAILSAANEEGRIEAALPIAKNAKLSVEEATEMLAGVPAGNGKSFQAKLKANDPDVPASSPNVDPAASPVAAFQADVSRHVAALLK